MVRYIAEATFALIVGYLVLNNAESFSKVVNAGGGVYNSAVKTLQGR